MYKRRPSSKNQFMSTRPDRSKSGIPHFFLPVHILIIPKGRFKDINDFSKNASAEQKIEIFSCFEILIDKFKLNANGCRILTNFGSNGRQEVPHLHFHLVGGKDVGRMFN